MPNNTDWNKVQQEIGDYKDEEFVQAVEDFNREKLDKQNLTRVVIADTQPHKNNMVSVAFAYANDLEKQNDRAPLVEHSTGNYILLAQPTLDKFLSKWNRDGDYAVFNAELHRDGNIAIPSLNTIERPDTPFDMQKHVKNTPSNTTLVNHRTGTEKRFSAVPTQTQSREMERDLEL